MPALNFQKQFAADVESGRKTRSIRAKRKDGRWPAKKGDTLHLFTGMRTKACRRLGKGECVDTAEVEIRADGVKWIGYELSVEARDTFAKRDGFADWPSMREWFHKVHGLPFHGLLIYWRLVK